MEDHRGGALRLGAARRLRSGSDIDLLVRFDPEAHWSILDHVQMEDELAEIFGRKVDLVSRCAIEESENTRRKKAILGSAEVILVR